jgi:hypothetical protein
MLRRMCSIGLLGLLSMKAFAAPLFPDVRDDHWAKDAVASLAASGLLEGYPDGTFKGDRAATRWEVAMMVARLLAKMEQSHATFATKAQLEQLTKLADALKDELSALGVRVTKLEEVTKSIDKRVGELERITFYGSLDAKVVAQSFYNTGTVDNDNRRAGAGTPGVPYLNYNTIVGANVGTTIRPQGHGVIPVVDYRNGRALVNGTGLTTRAILGLKVVVSPDMDAGAEFAAYSSQGNSAIDAYQGLAAPWLLNPFTANQAASLAAGGSNHIPYTRMVLDHFWAFHKPSKTRIRLGSIQQLEMDKFVYQGQPNLGIFGPKVFPGFGFQVNGEAELDADKKLKWEAFAVKIGAQNLQAQTNDTYLNLVVGADLALVSERFDFKLNYAHYVDETSGQDALNVGLQSTTTNTPYGNVLGYSPVQWVNPPGYFAQQRSGFEIANTGAAPNTVDTRPIPGWNGAADNALGLPASFGGNYGPQVCDVYGLSGNVRMPINDEHKLRLGVQLAHSNFKPSQNSAYSKGGNLGRFELGSSLFKDALDLSVTYLSVDASYNPVMQAGAVLGIRLVRPWNMTGRFMLHDFLNYPNNREGLQLAGRWDFDEKHGQIKARASFLSQKETSLYDVRTLQGSLGPNTPTNHVLGFSPGYFDTAFMGFATPYQYGARSASSFNDALQPLENPRGQVRDLGLNAYYRWDDPKLRIDVAYENTNFYRPSSLTPQFGGSQNFMDLTTEYAMIGLTWDADEHWTVRGGSEFVRAKGHQDPYGLYNTYAVNTASNSFANVDSFQTIPFVGLDYKFSKNMTWSNDLRLFNTTDSATGFAGSGEGARGFTSHPFSWSGLQMMSEFHVSF